MHASAVVRSRLELQTNASTAPLPRVQVVHTALGDIPITIILKVR